MNIIIVNRYMQNINNSFLQDRFNAERSLTLDCLGAKSLISTGTDSDYIFIQIYYRMH